MNEERYISVEQSIIDSCREVKLMRAGILPEPSLEELWEELDKDTAEEKFFNFDMAAAL